MNKETKQIDKTVVESRTVFNKENYKFMIIGLVITVLGFLLMTGGYSSDPNSFKPEEVYSFRRITLAPIVIILGLIVEIYAIMRKPKQ